MNLDTRLETKEEVIENATEIAYQAFKKNGWTYFFGAVTRNDIKENIERLFENAMEHGNASSGRITIQKDDYNGSGEIRIMLDLGTYFYDKEWD